MQAATLTDDSLQGDPTVAALERRAAALTGKPEALFISSGTMGNLLAALSHNQKGGTEAVIDARSHMLASEAGGISRLAGLFCVPIPSCKGEMDLDVLSHRIRGQYARSGGTTAFIAVETSHNSSGGYVPSLSYLESVKKLAGQYDIPVHMDGARAFNAAISLNVSLKEICQYSDSVTVCLSKGLSAPMGAVIAGTGEFIRRAKTFRKMLGGGLRQSGIMAAAGLVALNEGTERLADDHSIAQQIWKGLQDLEPRLVSSEPPQTNIIQVLTKFSGRPDQTWQTGLSQQNVLCRIQTEGVLRLVTHRHVGEHMVPEIISSLRNVLVGGE